MAATGSVGDVLAVFGVWAAISGAAQLVVALRRRALLGSQWPLLLAGGVSVIAGVVYLMAAAGDDPELTPLVLYTAAGGTYFVVQAWLPRAASPPLGQAGRPHPGGKLTIDWTDSRPSSRGPVADQGLSRARRGGGRRILDGVITEV